MDASPAATNLPDPDEALLLSALRQREAKAYEQLMRRYNRLLFRAARGIVADDGEAQDVVQETYLRAFIGLETFRGDASLGTWLTRIAINQALSQQRKLGRLVAWADEPATQEGDMSDSDLPTAPDAVAPSPEQETARRQTQRRLEQAVDALPPIYRSVFMLRAVEGLSVEDTAQALQVSSDVVKTRFLRARALLRGQLRPEDESQALTLHAFAGQRCDDMVARVLATLRASGVIRDH
jgi:RNA polymerase sigma-70 factor (ECF subfamily)